MSYSPLWNWLSISTDPLAIVTRWHLTISTATLDQNNLRSLFTYCRTNNIYINASAPYKHQQNFIECFVGAIKNGVRVALLYNKAPFYLWYHAMVYYIHTYNQVPRRNETRSKDEHFYNIKPDVSINIPFYAVGYAHNPKEIRKDKVYHP